MTRRRERGAVEDCAASGERAAAPRWESLLLLAGGESRRMGCEKAVLELPSSPRGRAPANASLTLIEWQLERLAPMFRDLRVAVAHDGPSRSLESALARFQQRTGRRVECLADAFPSGGPLVALASALRQTTGWVFVLAVDMPDVTDAAIAALGSATQKSCRAVVPHDGRRLQPAAAFYHAEIAPALAESIRHGEASLRSVAALPAVVVHRFESGSSVGAGGCELFDNLNSPAEFGAWCQRWLRSAASR